MQKEPSKSFRTGVLNLDLRSAFADLRSELDQAGLGLSTTGEEVLSTDAEPVLL